MPLSVLIVDDYEPLRAMVRSVFARAGADVREAHDGAAALSVFDAAPADIVLMDQNMPGMSGLALLTALRARSGAVRLIMLTGHGAPALAEAARAAGADAVLVKPVAPRELMSAVNAVMAA
jgi:two-component system, chemotaxis family, chemotaxis protein CheY